jgi:hypothetical protein
VFAWNQRRRIRTKTCFREYGISRRRFNPTFDGVIVSTHEVLVQVKKTGELYSRTLAGSKYAYCILATTGICGSDVNNFPSSLISKGSGVHGLTCGI